ncbi:MAG: MerR family transcriptional regulator [Bacillota bacterium]|nr:MerR family transcriptional regulator [Bacillota bacterium]
MKRIKEVSKLSGLSRRTLQYYDEQKLLQVTRSAENYRLYRDEDLQTLWKILLYKEMGFRLDKIRSLLSMDDRQAQNILQEHLAGMKAEIRELNKKCQLIGMIKESGIPDPDIASNEQNTKTYRERIRELFKNL